MSDGSPVLTARVNGRRFTVQCLGQPQIIGGTVVQDVEFDSGDRVTFRIALPRVQQLVNAWVTVLNSAERAAVNQVGATTSQEQSEAKGGVSRAGCV